MHGYEIIGVLEERSGGRWRPSAGSIYPTLQLLSDEGLVKAEEVDGKRVFSLTEEGTKAAEAITERRKSWEEDGEDSPYHRLRKATFQAIGAARQVGAAGDETQVDEAVKILDDARKRIYSILAND
jgi:DNA-binding PadR family transcriptional regulator